MSEVLPCHGYEDDWSAYLDGELTPERSAALTAHLSSCDACARRRDALRAADEALRDELALEELPADLRTRLQARIDADRVTSLDAARRRRRRRVGALLAAAAALALYLAVSSQSPIAPEPPSPDARVAMEEPDPADALLDEASAEELALALELDLIQDLDVIQNLDLIETLLLLEEGTG